MSELGATAGVGDRKDVSFYRFVTIDLAQARADVSPVELFRGSVLVQPDEVTRARLAATAEIESEIRRLWEFLRDLHALGRPSGTPPRREHVPFKLDPEKSADSSGARVGSPRLPSPPSS